MKKTFSTRFWAVLLAAALILCSALALYFARHTGGRAVARITVDGQVYREIDLSAVTGEYEFDVRTPEGINRVSVRPGGICVCSADCPDQVCVRQGWLDGGLTPIVCLPHRLVIELVSGGSPDAFDAVSGG